MASEAAAKIQRMIQPEALKKNERLLWAAGTGTDVWELFCSCIAGDLEAVKRLLAKDRSLVHTHYEYRTPIYFAVRENQLEVAAFLLDQGVNPLGLAINDSLLQIGRDLGYAEMDQLLEAEYASLHGASPGGEALATAIRERDLDKVKSLLDSTPKLLSVGDERGNQPIHWATMTRQLDVIDELLPPGSDVNMRRQDGAHPIQLTNGERGMNPSQPGLLPIKPLHQFARKGDVANAAIFIEHGADLHARAEDICSMPLGWAAKFGQTAMAELLLKHGAKPNLPDDPPWTTPLAWATRRGHAEIVELLKQHGTN